MPPSSPPDRAPAAPARERMPERVVAMAASAGGLSALSQILAELPADFGAPILLVLHLAPQHLSYLPTVLARATLLRVVVAEDGAALISGYVYVAPPDRHLTIDTDGRIRLTTAPTEHFSRPSANPLFRSVAEVFGPSAIGVICSGSGVDGAEGLHEIRNRGGCTIAQDQETSEHFGMPGQAIRRGAAARVLPLQSIAGELVDLIRAGSERHRSPGEAPENP